MNAFDLFKKISFGAKINVKRFRDDAKKFKMIKEEEILADEDVNERESEELINEITNESGKKGRKRKKKKGANVDEAKRQQIAHVRNLNKIYVNGSDISNPIENFHELKISQKILDNLDKTGFQKPTPIQMQAIPLMMEQRELVACAPTGSGKTLAFLIPILHQLKTPQKAGFRAVILAPTRELAKQIHREALWISNGTGLRIHIIKNVNLAMKKFGEQSSLKYDILVTTPNRLVYLLKQEPMGVNIKNIEWLVIDECDKLFEPTFRDQLSTIYNACADSPKVRHAMFSATFDSELEKWAKLQLDNVVTVVVGGKNKTTETVNQKLLYVGNQQGKLIALRDLISKGCKAPVLIFVETIDRAKNLLSEMIYDGVNIDAIHSDRTQQQRDKVVQSFREGKTWFLICTELMGRGIDFKGVNLVINYDFPQSAISYIHRIGRTGRAGRAGEAITFFTENDSEQLRSIANVMQQSGCDIPKFILDLAKHQRDMAKKQKLKERQKRLRERQKRILKQKTTSENQGSNNENATELVEEEENTTKDISAEEKIKRRKKPSVIKENRKAKKKSKISKKVKTKTKS